MTTDQTTSAVRRFLPKYLYALAATPFLFTVGVLSERHRFMIFQIAKHFGMKMPAEKELLPILPLSAVLTSKLDVTLLEPLFAGGNVSLLELMVIANVAKQAEPPMAFEIGTFDGRTTLNIAANLTLPAKVYTLDLPKSDLGETKFALAPGETAFVDKTKSGARFIGTAYEKQITQLYGDSATFDFSPYEGQMGLVFVDGSHSYDYILQDTANALRLASDNGFILWHDYQQDWPGVIRALNELKERDKTCTGLAKIEGTSLVMLKRENSRRPA